MYSTFQGVWYYVLLINVSSLPISTPIHGMKKNEGCLIHLHQQTVLGHLSIIC